MRSGTPIRHKSGLREWSVYISNTETGDTFPHGKVRAKSHLEALNYIPERVKMMGQVELVEIIIEE